MVLRSVFIIFISIVILMGISAQTKIGLVMGIDFLKAQGEPNGRGFQVIEKGFGNQAYLFGISAEQPITKKISFSQLCTYSSQYRVPVFDFSIAPSDANYFNDFRASLFFIYRFFDSAEMSFGPAFSFIPKQYSTVPTGFRREGEENAKEFGLSISTGYSWRNFSGRVLFYKGTNWVFNQDTIYTPEFKPNSSISFLIGYQFSTKKEKRKMK